MATLNNVTILGRLVKDPEMQATSTDKHICRFTVAFDKRGKDAGANFVDAMAWENRAEYLAKYGQKGSQILLQGRLDQQTWEKDGKKNSKISIIADEIQILTKAEPRQDTTQTDYAPTTEDFDKEIGDGEVSLNDIPF